ncbi:MAG TPA: hypothetical protein VLF66_14380, partial [Thermoanaerobaculia bacterium]|nr:hypothetical protein [Thermoanaerobaculia bacterium]
MPRTLDLRRLAPFVLPPLWAGLTALVAVRVAGYAPDDMFITYRYAWNLAHGDGLVFNPGERVFGLTNPGHALFLALLHGVTRVPVHLLGGLVFALALWALIVLVWVEARRRGTAVEAALGGTLVLGASYVWANAGSASSSVLALLAGSALLLPRRPVAAGALAGMAVWYRPDAVLGVAALGLLAWSERRRLPLRWALVAGGVIVLGAVAAWLWFGSPLPETLEAKRIMAESRPAPWTGPERFWARAAPLFRRNFGPGWLLLVAMGLAGQWPLFARGGRAVRTVVLYGTAVAVAYPLLGVPYFSWYTVPPVVALLLGAGALAVGVGRAVSAALVPGGCPEDASTGGDGGPGRRPWSRHLASAAGAVVAATLLAIPGIHFAKATAGRLGALGGETRFETYREAALWIRDHSLPEERIAYGEIGNLAYWSRRPVDDLMGLVTPGVLPYVAARDGVGAFLLRP